MSPEREVMDRVAAAIDQHAGDRLKVVCRRVSDLQTAEDLRAGETVAEVSLGSRITPVRQRGLKLVGITVNVLLAHKWQDGDDDEAAEQFLRLAEYVEGLIEGVDGLESQEGETAEREILSAEFYASGFYATEFRPTFFVTREWQDLRFQSRSTSS